MSHRFHAVASLSAVALVFIGAPSFADTSYDFSSVPQDTTVTPYTLQGATFDSPDGGAGAFTFGANGGLYSQLGSSVLSSAGLPATLSISFATAQTGLSFAYAIGDEYLKNQSTGVYSGLGSDALTVMTNTGYTTTINLAAPATNQSGPAYVFPQSLFSLAGALPFTSVTIEAADSGGEEALAISTLSTSVTPVPLPATAWLLLGGVGGAAGFMRRRK